MSCLRDLVIPRQEWCPWSPVLPLALDEFSMWDSGSERTSTGAIPVQHQTSTEWWVMSVATSRIHSWVCSFIHSVSIWCGGGGVVSKPRLALCDPVDCSPSGFFVHGISQSRILVGCHFLLQGIFPTQGSNLPLLHCRPILYCLSQQGSPSVCWVSTKCWGTF